MFPVFWDGKTKESSESLCELFSGDLGSSGLFFKRNGCL